MNILNINYLKKILEKAIYDYNEKCPHSSLKGLTPREVLEGKTVDRVEIINRLERPGEAELKKTGRRTVDCVRTGNMNKYSDNRTGIINITCALRIKEYRLGQTKWLIGYTFSQESLFSAAVRGLDMTGSV